MQKMSFSITTNMVTCQETANTTRVFGAYTFKYKLTLFNLKNL